VATRMGALLCVALAVCAPVAALAEAETASDVDDLSLEELLDIEVTSASKKPQRAVDVPTALYVITQEDIRRSGHTSIPELLRMVPGVNVRRSGSNWGVGIRGDQNKFSRMLLVLVDGRSVYTPSFGGTFWDFQEMPLEDIERIEVIRGPGASIWGSNAVHGVINIIRKRATDSKGLRLSVLAGNEERLTTSASHGGSLGDALDWRVSGRLVSVDGTDTRAGDHRRDDHRQGTLQLRSDWRLGPSDTLTLQGDWVGGERAGAFRRDRDGTGTSFFVANEVYGVRGGNSMLRYEHQFSERANAEAQLYWDTTSRNLPLAREKRSTVDIELRNHIDLGAHDLNWGVGARHQADRWNDSINLMVAPDEQREAVYSSFAQDDFQLRPDLTLTLGSRLEWNTYTRWEVQPTFRFFWAPIPHHQFWGSAARAVRIPARADREIVSQVRIIPGAPPVGLAFVGSPDFESEVVIEYDLGWRLQPLDTLQLDLAVFTRETENQKAFAGVPPFIIVQGLPVPALVSNRGETHALGGEAAIRWQAQPWWRLILNYSHVNIDSKTAFAQGGELSAPHHQVALLSQLSLPGAVELDLNAYYATRVVDIGDLPDPSVMRYDARIAWRPTERLEIAAVGQNLFDRRHFELREFYELEGITGVGNATVPRSVYVQVRTEF
jgi:iron complex outermembrane recepter protein